MSRPGKTKSIRHPASGTNELATIAAAFLRRKSRLRPALAVVLGSGYDHFIKKCTKILEIPYGEIPGFLEAKVEGHAGSLILGLCEKIPIIILNGRCHYYEGHSMEEITFPIRVLASYGIDAVLLTNAAGAINKSFKPGEFMRVKDHINLMGDNPIRGWDAELPSRFVDMSTAYDAGLAAMLKRAAKIAKVKLLEGVYLAVAGPSYETPAEINAFYKLGADAVGMSTVPEVIVARHCGMRVAGISCITNPAAGRGKQAISHKEVLAVSKAAQDRAGRLISEFVKQHGTGK
jgi:purine-nucleoside phosphorylase